MPTFFLLFLFMLFQPLCAEELLVHLATQKGLTPVTVAPIQDNKSGFDTTYLQALEAVLRFDFQNNGKTEIKAAAPGISKIESVIADKKLTVKLTIAPTGKVKGVEAIGLTGNLAHDRRTLHQVHDTLFETWFGIPGVAQTHILYTVRTRLGALSSQWVSEVWSADYDGENARQITQDHNLSVTPLFFPQKPGNQASHFLYVSYKGGQPKIYVASLHEGAGKRLTFLRGDQLMPALSPQKDRLAFISDITGNPDLFIQRFSPEKGLSGKPQQIFCAPGAAQGSPTFSPDGQKIAFVSNKDGTPRIYILSIPGEGASIKQVKAEMITKKTKENTSPCWSPDGKKIAYSALCSGVRQICLYDVATREERQLTEGREHKENPVWGANSLQLIYHATSGNQSDLYLIHLNQSKGVKITKGAGEKRFPAWEAL